MLNFILAVAASAAFNAGAAQADTVPLFDDLGDHHYPITTGAPAAQAYFDQGLRLYYAFNHQEAIRAFRHATTLDPSCAMCFWGIAQALGPNINMPMDPSVAVDAWEAIETAQSLAAGTSARERVIIEASALRYAPSPEAPRAPLDSAYALALARGAERFPNDLEIATLSAEARMNLRPWSYWTGEGEPEPGTPELLETLERVLAANRDHPGACHFYIHAVEAVHPDRAVPCAERLAALMPGAGHIVHMPGHIYIRVGRYADAIAANEHAVHADESYIRDQRPGANLYTAGYYPHNYDFLAFAAAMAGRKGQSLEAAAQVARLVPRELLGAEGMLFLQQFQTRILQMQVRFGEWDQILAAAEPDPGLPYARAIWHYARGRALAARGQAGDARSELDALRALARGPELEGKALEFNTATQVLGIAEGVLAGYLAAATGRFDRAVAHLNEAARLEDGLVYGEPPEWSVPVRQDMGAILLAAGDPARAEAAFLKDLDRFPRNGWSLRGLESALRAQDRIVEADAVRAQLLEAWEGAGEHPSPAGEHEHRSR
jgi:tetratricopeptide (TPR) repeat protein